MKLFKFSVLSAAVLAGGCATNQWHRADGGPISQWQFDRAIHVCRDRASERDQAERAMRRCMYRHGYVWGGGGGYDD